jgi:hypothetical protein
LIWRGGSRRPACQNKKRKAASYEKATFTPACGGDEVSAKVTGTKLKKALIPRPPPSMAGGGCKWGQKNFEIVFGYINIMDILQYGIKHYSKKII